MGVFWTSHYIIAKNWQPFDMYDVSKQKYHGNIHLLITADVPHISFIDINATIAQNFISSEEEIRLFRNKKLNGVEIFNKKNESLPVNHINFYS